MTSMSNGVPTSSSSIDTRSVDRFRTNAAVEGYGTIACNRDRMQADQRGKEAKPHA